MKRVLSSCIATLAAACWIAGAAQADVLLISTNVAATAAPTSAFFTDNFSNITEVRIGNYANFGLAATQDAVNGTGAFAGMGVADFVVFNRLISSTDYQNNVSAGYNTINIPVVSLTSFVTRPDTGRLGWHTGGVLANGNTNNTAGNETTLTAAGAAIFGGTSGTTVDWFVRQSGTADFNAPGSGTVGEGSILATIGASGGIIAARWDAGQLLGNGTAAGGARLLFNLDDTGGADAVFNDSGSQTATGRAALVTALQTVGFTATAVPEPSSLAVLFFISAGVLAFVRHRKCSASVQG